MKKKLTLSKKELIKMWKAQCSNPRGSSLDKTEGMYSIHFQGDISIPSNRGVYALSLALFNGEIKIIFGEQIEYLSEKLSKKEFSELESVFNEAEENVERLRRDRITANGLKALENLLD